MAGASAARVQGDRYQHLYSWWELLQLLDEDSLFDHGFVEHPEAGSADDVTLHAHAGAGGPSRFVQVKFHVDQRDLYSLDSLVQVGRGLRSLLSKLFDSWQRLRDFGPVEVWLVSNWAAAPDLGRFIRDDRTLAPEFFGGRESARVTPPWARWRDELGANDEELRGFCDSLRLRLGFNGFSELETLVDDRMRAHGLRHGESARADAVSIVVDWITRPGTDRRITRERLLEVIRRRRLRAGDEAAPRVALVVHGWSHDAFDVKATVQFDWSEHFDHGRRIFPEPAFWESEILPKLEEVAGRFARRRNGAGMFVDVRGKMPLSISLLVGFAFRRVKGFRIRVRQSNGPEGLWHSDAGPSDAEFVIQWREGARGEDLLVALGVTGTNKEQVEAMFKAGAFTAGVYAEPLSAPSDHAIAGEADAVALAESAKELIRNAARVYGARRTHLVLFGPMGFAMFLGQLLSSLGEVTIYERTKDGGYSPAVTILTG